MDRKCLVLGGGREAEEKSARLLDAGAQITLLADALTPALAARVQEGRITHKKEAFAEADLDGAFLVLNTIADDPELTRRVWELATARNLLITPTTSRNTAILAWSPSCIPAICV